MLKLMMLLEALESRTPVVICGETKNYAGLSDKIAPTLPVELLREEVKEFTAGDAAAYICIDA